MKKITIKSDQAMIRLGEYLGERAQPGDLLFLSGDLGAGKTTLVKGIARGMKIDSEITSPTFQLIKTYQGRYWLSHMDLYRLGQESEIEIFELEDLTRSGITVIEWGELIKDRLFNDYLEVVIGYSNDLSSRDVVLNPSGSSYERMIGEIDDVDFGD